MEENKFDYDVFDLNSYDYYLPEELIAQSPAEKRDESRLLTLCKDDGKLEDKHFFDILDYLKPGDVLVWNNLDGEHRTCCIIYWKWQYYTCNYKRC